MLWVFVQPSQGTAADLSVGWLPLRERSQQELGMRVLRVFVQPLEGTAADLDIRGRTRHQ